MICGRCGTANVAGRRFCLECGSPLAAGCSTCGAANEPAAKFCGTCGTRLGEAAEAGSPGTARAAVAAASPAAERRMVSVMFVDLVGFTHLAEDRDPEAIRELLSAYFDAASEIVRRYGGAVEKFIGDAVMAVWGTPVAHEDDAERAVRAALDIVEAVPTLRGEGAGPEMALRARAGVLTGEAAVTVGAVGQGMIAGDLVNTASRLQAAAAPGDGARRRGDPPGGRRFHRVRAGRRGRPQGQGEPGPGIPSAARRRRARRGGSRRRPRAAVRGSRRRAAVP